MLVAIRIPSSTTESVRYSPAVSPTGGSVHMPSLTRRMSDERVSVCAASILACTSASWAARPYRESGWGAVLISALCSPSSFSKPMYSNRRRGTRLSAVVSSSTA